MLYYSLSLQRTTQTSLTKRLSSLIETLRREPEKAGHTSEDIITAIIIIAL